MLGVKDLARLRRAASPRFHRAAFWAIVIIAIVFLMAGALHLHLAQTWARMSGSSLLAVTTGWRAGFQPGQTYHAEYLLAIEQLEDSGFTLLFGVFLLILAPFVRRRGAWLERLLKEVDGEHA